MTKRQFTKKLMQFIPSILFAHLFRPFFHPFSFASKQHNQSWKNQFQQSLNSKPWLIGFQGTQKEYLKANTLQTSGNIPKELNGQFYRNGPAQHELNQFRYHHWFDGNSMVQKFDIRDQKVTHLGRMIHTKKYLLEKKNQRPIIPTFGTSIPNPIRPKSPDDLNVANINTLPIQDQLFALWEGGSPYEIDPISLKTIALRPVLNKPGFPFSAHPRVDQDGSIWNFGYFANPRNPGLMLYHLNQFGKLQKYHFIKTQYTPMVHDFMITQNYLIIPIPPFFLSNLKATNFLDSFQWNYKKPTQILIVDKNNFKQYSFVDTNSPSWIFHYSNAWEDQKGTIHFDCPQYPNPNIMTLQFRNVMKGQVTQNSLLTPPSQYVQYSINPKSKTAKEKKLNLPTMTEFPKIDHRKNGSKNRYIILIQANHPKHPLFNTLIRYDVVNQKYQKYQYDPYTIIEEHIFVPHPTKNHENHGWIIGTSLNFKQKISSLNIFDANQIQNGPRAIVKLPYLIPLGFHGQFRQN